MDEKTDERLGRAINEYLNHYVLVTDGKAAAVAAASLVLLGLVLTPEGATLSTASAAAAAKGIGTFLAAVSTVIAGSVLYPRTPHSGNGHIFWADIRSFDSATSYWKSISSLDSDAIGLEYARQNFNVSEVLIRKTQGVRRAIWAFAAACLCLTYAYGV